MNEKDNKILTDLRIDREQSQPCPVCGKMLHFTIKKVNVKPQGVTATIKLRGDTHEKCIEEAGTLSFSFSYCELNKMSEGSNGR